MNPKLLSRVPIKFLLFVLIGLSTLIGPLFFIQEYQAHDWPYHNSMLWRFRSMLLHYQTLSFHDVWRCGGLDLLENPQTRFFSPIHFWIDLLFIPQVAHWISMGVMSGLGSAGMYKLLRDSTFEPQTPRSSALIGSLVWVSSSFFALHFIEGHMTYVGFLLLPWLFYFSRKLDDPLRLLGLSTLMAFFLLDGAMYAFIFGLYGLLFGFMTGVLPLKNWWASIKRKPANELCFLFLCSAFAILAAAPKLWPILTSLKNRNPAIEQISIAPWDWPKVFLFPFQRYKFSISGQAFGYHEYSAYLGIPSLVLAFIALKNKWASKNWIFFGLLFFWTGTGLFKYFNPWFLFFNRIPFLNNAHVQTRLLIWVILAAVVLASRGLGFLQLQSTKRKTFLGLVMLLMIEAVTVRNYPWEHAKMYPPNHFEPTTTMSGFITSATRTHTVPVLPEFFLANPELHGGAVKDCYEPAKPFEPLVKTNLDPDYSGEIWNSSTPKTADPSSAKIVRFSPAGLEVEIAPLAAPQRFTVNTHDLGSWKILSAEPPQSLNTARLLSKRGELLAFEAGPSFETQRIVLKHERRDLPYLIFAYFFGMTGLGALYIWLRKRRLSQAV